MDNELLPGQRYGKRFRAGHVSGRLLAGLTAAQLEAPPLGVANAMHREALLQGVRSLVLQPCNNAAEWDVEYVACWVRAASRAP